MFTVATFAADAYLKVAGSLLQASHGPEVGNSSRSSSIPLPAAEALHYSPLHGHGLHVVIINAVRVDSAAGLHPTDSLALAALHAFARGLCPRPRPRPVFFKDPGGKGALLSRLGHQKALSFLT